AGSWWRIRWCRWRSRPRPARTAPAPAGAARSRCSGSFGFGCRTQIVHLSDRHAVVPQNGVRRGDVEIEIGQAEFQQIDVAARLAQFLERDDLAFAALEVLGL